MEEPLPKEYDPKHLDCLLYPEEYAPVISTDTCADCFERACQKSCIFDAIETGKEGELFINPSRCEGCAACIDVCKSNHLAASKDVLPAMRAVQNASGPVYLMIAPAFSGQFRGHVTAGKLRSACKALGFTGMVEVALFADILTLKEALEFERHVRRAGRFSAHKLLLSGLDRNDPKEVSRIITACSRGSLSDGCLRTVFEANPSGCGDDICRSLSCKEKRGKRA